MFQNLGIQNKYAFVAAVVPEGINRLTALYPGFI
jgi:hypothetical protein